jgi:peptidase YpeB-like protein
VRNNVNSMFMFNGDDGRMKKALVILTLALSVTGLYAAEKQPKISMKKAKTIALAKVPGGKIASSELENEGGLLIYSFDIKNKDGKAITEVNVDAMNGKVVAVQNESPAKEAAEKKAEQKKH